MKKRRNQWNVKSLLMTLVAVITAAVFTGCSSKGMGEKIPTFSATTIQGEAITNEIFKDKKVTMINFWGTFCGPCIEEMPDLGDLAREMPEGTQLVGVVTDIIDGENLALGNQILTNANADFINIIPDKALLDYSKNLIGVPTTVFVDENGNIIGKPVIGSLLKEEYKAKIEELVK